MNQTKPTVERDANGVPTSWLLVRAGPIPLRKNGADYELELTSKDLSEIVSYQRPQGGMMPLNITAPLPCPVPTGHFRCHRNGGTIPGCHAPLFHEIADIIRK